MGIFRHMTFCDLYSTPLLMEEHGGNLLLQGSNHGKELLLSGG